jgi:DNA-binding CsgD family transcriptional regulator
LAEITHLEGDTESTKHFCREYLQVILDLKLEFRIHEGGDLLIQLLLEAGETQRAIELLVLVKKVLLKQGNPFGGTGFDEQYEHRLRTLGTNLAPDVFREAIHRGETLDPFIIIAELVDGFLAPEGVRQRAAMKSGDGDILTNRELTDLLTERELEILRLIADGLSNRDIASKLIFSLGTVKWYVHQIHSKLGVSRRTQAIARARELNLL